MSLRHVGVARLQGLLRRDVVEGAEGDAGLGQVAVAGGAEAAGQAHVDELGPAGRRDDDVRRLDVAVDDAAGRGVGQAGRHLQQ